MTVVGFTARSEASDPETVREFQHVCFAAVAAEVERYGGTVEKYIGDAQLRFDRLHEDPEASER